MSSFSTSYSAGGSGIAFNMSLLYLGMNDYGAHMYRDPLNRTVVRIDDHGIVFDQEPWYNYQGDTLIDQASTRYVAVINAQIVDKMDQYVVDPNQEIPEKPPTLELTGHTLCNKVECTRIITDNHTMGVYMCENEDQNIFYFSTYPSEHTLLPKKVLYMFIQLNNKIVPDLDLLIRDKYNVNYQLMKPEEVAKLTHRGETVINILKAQNIAKGKKVHNEIPVGTEIEKPEEKIAESFKEPLYGLGRGHGEYQSKGGSYDSHKKPDGTKDYSIPHTSKYTGDLGCKVKLTMLQNG